MALTKIKLNTMVTGTLPDANIPDDITIDTAAAAPANALTGNTLASGVTASSLTSVGTLSSLAVGNVTSTGYAQITNGLRTSTGTERYLVLREGNELNLYSSSGIGDSNRQTLHINHLGAGSTVDLSESELVVVKGTGSTFAGVVTASGSTGSNYIGSFTNTSATGWGLFVKGGADNADYALRVQDKDANDLFSIKGGGSIGVGTNDPSSAANVLLSVGNTSLAYSGMEFIAGSNAERWRLYTSFDGNNEALFGLYRVADSSYKFQVGENGNTTFAGNVTTGGAIEITSCPDNNALTFDQSGREHSIYTYFSGTTADNRMTFRLGTGSTGGTKVDVIDLYGDKRAIFQGNITTEGQIISKKGMEIQGTSLAGSQSGIASSGTGGDLRMYISGNQNYTLSGHTLTLDSLGNGTPAQLTLRNNGSSGWTGAAINLLYNGSSGNRGQGIYLHSEASDKEWYLGTMYSVDNDRFSLCYESRASFGVDTAEAAHEIFYIGTSGQTWANGGYYATFTGTAVHALVGHTNELNICNSWTSGQNQIHFNYRMGNTYGDFTFFNGSSSGYPDLNAASFDTTSDYRMKKSVTNFTANVCDKIKLLRPVTYKWKANTKMNEAQQIGFLAHELQEQLPLAVKGEKDAMSEKDNTKIEPQTIKGEALSSYMMKALQEIITRLEVLENA